MAKLVFLPIAQQTESSTYLLYDGACGTGGMLTVAEDMLQQIAREQGKTVSAYVWVLTNQKPQHRCGKGNSSTPAPGSSPCARTWANRSLRRNSDRC